MSSVIPVSDIQLVTQLNPRHPIGLLTAFLQLLTASNDDALLITSSDHTWGGINDRFVMTTRSAFSAYADLFQVNVASMFPQRPLRDDHALRLLRLRRPLPGECCLNVPSTTAS
jgi:hypothetical protein